jgi:hypothetical protein
MVDRKRSGREREEEERPRRSASPSLEELEKGLRIDRDDLEEAEVAQPMSYYEVAKQAAIYTSQRDAAYQAIKEVTAEEDQKVRSSIPADEKVTEKSIESEVRTSKRVKEANARHLQLAEKSALWGALLQAFTMRSYALKDLVAMRLKEYSMSAGYAEAEAENIRRQANDARRNYSNRDGGRRSDERGRSRDRREED